MAVEPADDGSLRVRHDGTLIAEAAPAPRYQAPAVPALVSMAEAEAAAGGARYFADTLFPTCFGCGMSRAPGDGLRIFPGPVPGRDLWAAPWTPDPAVGDACRVIAWPAGRDGRKLTAGSALLGPDDEVLAVASTLWLTVPRSAPAAGGAS